MWIPLSQGMSGFGDNIQLNINCKKSKSMIVSKRIIPKCKLQIEDSKFKQVQKLKYPGGVLTEDGMCKIEIWRCIKIDKDA